MRFNYIFLRSRLARRVLLLFVFCAVLPITAMFFQSFSELTSQLRDQSYRRLQQLSKAVGMASYERLLLLDGEMQMISSSLEEGGPPAVKTKGADLGEGPENWFHSICILNDHGTLTPIFGKMSGPPVLSSQDRQDLDLGKTAIVTQPGHGSTSRVFMLREIIDRGLGPRLLVGEINNAYLWGIGPQDSLPPMTELFVLDQSGTPIVSSLPVKTSMIAKAVYSGNGSTSRQFQWKYGGRDFLACYWTLFLRSRFDAPNWTVVLSRSSAEVLAPMAYFRKVYPFMTLLCMLVVLLLSMIYIRRALDPLKTLKDGTLQVSSGNFNYQVQVATGDELEELAASFNAMSSRLGRQFNALTTIAELDRAILSSIESKEIVKVMLRSLHDFFGCDFGLICLIDPEDPGKAQAFVRSDFHKTDGPVGVVETGPEDIGRLRDNRRYLQIDMQQDAPRYLSAFAANGVKSFTVLPVFLKDELLAIVNMGYFELNPDAERDLENARQLADQMAIGLSNANLLGQLEQLNWGALQALARTVDAKSPWTAGHSERVTNLALEIAESLDLPPREKDMLRRAALLHDIGKIGTPHSILDKPTGLTDEEYNIIREHPATGARILEPIGAYRDIIPVISQHHERYDGKGYPRGLAGEDIVPAARILAVADVFDALISERPYRAGWNLNQVIEHMREQAGRQFDPGIIDVFLKNLAGKERKSFVEVHAFPYHVA